MVCCSIWINSASNASMNSVIVLGYALDYYNFPTSLPALLILNTTANHTITYANILLSIKILVTCMYTMLFFKMWECVAKSKRKNT